MPAETLWIPVVTGIVSFVSAVGGALLGGLVASSKSNRPNREPNGFDVRREKLERAFKLTTQISKTWLDSLTAVDLAKPDMQAQQLPPEEPFKEIDELRMIVKYYAPETEPQAMKFLNLVTADMDGNAQRFLSIVSGTCPPDKSHPEKRVIRAKNDLLNTLSQVVQNLTRKFEERGKRKAA